MSVLVRFVVVAVVLGAAAVAVVVLLGFVVLADAAVG